MELVTEVGLRFGLTVWPVGLDNYVLVLMPAPERMLVLVDRLRTFPSCISIVFVFESIYYVGTGEPIVLNPSVMFACF